MRIGRKTVSQYILMVLLIYLSGNVYFRNFNYSSSVALVFLFAFLVYFFTTEKNKFKCSIPIILTLIVYAILIILTVLLNQELKFSSYIAIYLQMIIAAIASKIIPIDNFKRIYINIITFLAMSSLFFHLIGMLYPEVVFLFPKTEAIASVDYYNAVIHVYQALIGYGRFVLHTRNAGIFWEPGAYQAFLNIGLIFFLDVVSKDAKYNKYKHIILVTLLLAIISTYSTTGYIILLLILFSYRKVISQILAIKKMKDLVFITVIIVIGIFFISKEIHVALILIGSKYLDGSHSWFDRISLDKFILLLDVKTFFFGMSFTKYFEVTTTIWNSIIQTAVVFGVPFTLILLFRYLKGSIYFVKRRWLLFFILIIIFSTENLFWRPFFLYFAFVEVSGINVRGREI